MLQNALYGTRKASRLWQRFLRDVLADADWKASVIFASLYTLGDQRGTLGCWGDDFLVEADEVDLDAVEAHLVRRLEVKVLARLGGKQSGEIGFLKRVLRHDDVTGSFTWCSGERYVQDAATTLQLMGRTTECKTADTPGTKGTGAALRDGDQKLDGDDTAAFRSALGSVMYVALDRPEILYSTKTVASFMQSPTSSSDWCAIWWGSFRSVPGRVRRQRLGRRRGAKTLDHWSRGDLRRSHARRRVGHAIAGCATQRGGGVLRLQPRHRGWTADGSLPDRGGLQDDSASVERQQRLPWDRPQYRLRQAQALGDPTHVDTGAAAER